MSSSQKPAASHAYFDSVVFFFLSIALYSLNLASVRSTKIFNADLITPFLIAQDFLKDPTLLGSWSFPDAPYFFPDTLLAIALVATVGDVHTSVLVSIALNVIFFCSIVFWLVRATGHGEHWTAIAALLVISHLALAAFDPITYEMVLTSQFRLYIHSGAFLAAGVSACLVLEYLRTNQRRYCMILAALATVMTGSDALYVVQFVAPATAIFFLIGFYSKEKRAPLLNLGIAIWLGVGAALLWTKILGIRRPDIEVAGDQILLSGLSFFRWANEHVYLLLAMTALLTYIAAKQRARPHLDPGTVLANKRSGMMLVLGSALAVIFSIAAAIITGKFGNEQSFRYALSIQWLIALAPIGFDFRRRKNVLSERFWGVIFGLAIVSSIISTATNAVAAASYVHPITLCFRQISGDTRSFLAIGDYWNAKVTSTFAGSHTQTMVPVTPQGQPYLWAFSERRFSDSLKQSADAGLNASLLNWSDVSFQESAFGRFQETISCNGFRFGIFEDPAESFKMLSDYSDGVIPLAQ